MEIPPLSDRGRMIERIEAVRDIEELRKLFIATMHSYESEVVALHAQHEQDLDDLRRALSEERHGKGGKRRQDEVLEELRSQVNALKEENGEVRKLFGEFVKTSRTYLRELEAKRTKNLHALGVLKGGLVELKQEVVQLRQNAPGPGDFDLLGVKMEHRRQLRMFQISKRLLSRRKEMSEERIRDSKLKDVLNHSTSLRLNTISIRSGLLLYQKGFFADIQQIRDAVDKLFESFVQRQMKEKQKKQQQRKQKESEIRKLQSEIELLKMEKTAIKQKSEAQRSQTSQSRSRTSASTVRMQTPPRIIGRKVDVGTLARIGTPESIQLKEMTLRHSREAELSVLRRSVENLKAENEKLEKQLGGLHKILRRTESQMAEYREGAQQRIIDLEEGIREQQRQQQRKDANISAMQRELNDLRTQSASVEPYIKTIRDVFGSCVSKLEAVLEESQTPPDLNELDELAQQIFNVPIRRLAVPAPSRGFIRKVERRLQDAMRSADSEGMSGAIQALLDEIFHPRD